MTAPPGPAGGKSYAHRVLVAVGVVITAALLLYLVFWAFPVIMLLFAGILIGVLMNGAANLLRRGVPIPYKPAVGIVIVVFFVLTAAFWWYAGPAIASQAGELGETTLSAISDLESWLQDRDWGESLLEQVPSAEALWETIGSGGALGRLRGVVSTIVATGFDLFIIFFVAIYCALNPGVYVNNAIKLFPIHRRERMHEVATRSARALKLWLVGQFVSMLFVAVFVYVGLTILGVPLALVLAVMSFAFGFIPYLGPILAAVPALLVAFVVSPMMVVYVGILYFILENVQSYVVIPLIQEAVVSLPPVLLIAAQLLFAAFAGILGIALAAPIVVIIVVFVQMLYVEDALGDRVPVIGSKEGSTKEVGA
jgi:predicted PurR-regulated permease PerM